MPGAAVTSAELGSHAAALAGLPIMVQPQLCPLAQETERPHVLRPVFPPNMTSFMFGSTGTPSSRPATPPIPTETQWDNPAQLIARSIALRQSSAAGAPLAPTADVAPTQRVASAAVDDDRPPRDPVLVAR